MNNSSINSIELSVVNAAAVTASYIIVDDTKMVLHLDISGSSNAKK
jgi:hypothetical protein